MAFTSSSSVARDKKPLGQGLSSLHHTTQRLMKFEKKIFHDEDSFKRMLNTSLSDPSDQSFKSHVVTAYTQLYQTHTELTDEESLINRMERNAHVRKALLRNSMELNQEPTI
ncbi:hypothetical protein [Vibrio coralliirubri]|uniref:hypothetical protein n=1 Tax=Vibrio coralliirubri TaxID=1516159 RepID=UPI0021C3C0EE|nr:hypothetical protein [Vibrio coralliirubri]